MNSIYGWAVFLAGQDLGNFASRAKGEKQKTARCLGSIGRGGRGSTVQSVVRLQVRAVSLVALGSPSRSTSSVCVWPWSRVPESAKSLKLEVKA